MNAFDFAHLMGLFYHDQFWPYYWYGNGIFPYSNYDIRCMSHSEYTAGAATYYN